MIMMLGVLCGVALAITGGAGAIIALPLLVSIQGVTLNQAVSLTLVLISVSALFALLPILRWQHLQKRMVSVLSLSGCLLVPLGVKVAQVYPAVYVLKSYTIFMIIVGGYLLFKRHSLVSLSQVGHSAKQSPLYTDKKIRNAYPTLVLLGLIGGFLTGLYGIAGGILLVPALILLLNIPIERAIASSLLTTFFISSYALFVRNGWHSIDWMMALQFLLGSIFGVTLCAKSTSRVRGLDLTKMFGVSIIIFALFMLMFSY